MDLEITMKHTRVSSGNNLVAGESDRLSALPDCLLHTIMSFMKARQVVQTCVLSKRWKNLWSSAPCLDIDLDEFKTGPTLMYFLLHIDRDWEAFEDFAVNLLLHGNIALLDSFRLNVPRIKAPYFGGMIAASWLRRAMKYHTPNHDIQRKGLSSNSWHMKRMDLCNVFLDNRFAEHVSSVCHSLENLELKDCTCELYAITSHSLKNLVMENCVCSKLSHITSPALKSLVIDGGSNACDDCLVITTPSVTYLHLAVDVNYFYAGISMNEMPSLDKALIHLLNNRETEIENKLGDDQFKLLSSVSNVTSVELSNLRTMVFSVESTKFKQFKNLRNLLLENCDLSDDFQTLTVFLENSPNLEKLTLRHCKFSNDSKKANGAPESNKSSTSQCCSMDFLCANLKLTEIIYKDNIVPLVEFLLSISENLPNNEFEFRKVD